MGISEKNEWPLERVEYLARTHTRRDAETDARSYALGLRIIGKKLPRREGRPEHRATDSRRKTSRLSIVKPTAILETTRPVNCSSVGAGTRSKRNFHRPESNCGVAINSGCEVFI